MSLYSSIHYAAAKVEHSEKVLSVSTISFPKKRPTFLDVCVLSNRVRVVIKIDPNFQFRFGGKGHSSPSEPIIMLEPEQPKSLQWFVDAIHRFENFLSLCLGSSVRAKTVRLRGGRFCSLIYRTARPAKSSKSLGRLPSM